MLVQLKDTDLLGNFTDLYLWLATRTKERGVFMKAEKGKRLGISIEKDNQFMKRPHYLLDYFLLPAC